MNIVKRIKGVTQGYDMHNRFMDDFSRDIDAEVRNARKVKESYQRQNHPSKQQSTKALTAKDIMTTDIRTLPDSATMMEALLLLEKYGFRHIPVLNSKQEIVGILSDRDLLTVQSNVDLNKAVTEFMSHELIASRPTTTIKELAGVMIFEKVHALPVTTSDEKIIGIVTSTDILRALWRNAPVELWA